SLHSGVSRSLLAVAGLREWPGGLGRAGPDPAARSSPFPRGPPARCVRAEQAQTPSPSESVLVRWLATGVGARTAAPSRPGMLPQPQLVWAQDLGRPPLPDPASFRSRRVDAPGGPFCTRRAAAFVLGALCLTQGTGLAAPGDPLGPDDTGCAPASREELRCESTLADALSTLVAQMTRCKLQQADNAFRILYPRSGSTQPPRFDEERCAQSQAKAPFDLALSQLEGAGLCPPAALVNAHELGNTLIAGPLTPGSPGVFSGAVYCDGACARHASISRGSSRCGTPPSPPPSRRAGASSSARGAPRRPRLPRRPPPAPPARPPRTRSPRPPPPRGRRPPPLPRPAPPARRPRARSLRP